MYCIDEQCGIDENVEWSLGGNGGMVRVPSGDRQCGVFDSVNTFPRIDN
jgi:hypothetical protein